MTVYKMSAQYNASVPGPCASYRRVLRMENKVTADAAWQVQVKREQIPQVGNKFTGSKEVLHVSREKVSAEPIHRGTNPLLHRPEPDPDPGRSSRFSFMRTTFSLRYLLPRVQKHDNGLFSHAHVYASILECVYSIIIASLHICSALYGAVRSLSNYNSLHCVKQLVSCALYT